MKRIFNYWKEFTIDFNIWRKYRKVAKQNEEFLLQSGMRVDWLGRIYTVINMPEEVINNQDQVQQGWVISQLGPLNDVLMKIGLADYAYPEISLVPGSASYLIVMYPEIDALNPWRMIWNLLGLSVLGTFIYVMYRVAISFGLYEMILNLINGQL